MSEANEFLNAINVNSESQENITESEWEKINKEKEKVLSCVTNSDLKMKFEQKYQELDSYFAQEWTQIHITTSDELNFFREILWGCWLEKTPFNSLSDEDKQKLTNENISIGDYNNFLQKYQFSAQEWLDTVIYFQKAWLFDLKFLSQIWNDAKELKDNSALLKEALINEDNIKLFFDNWLDIWITLQNIKFSKERWKLLSPQQYYDFWWKLLTQELYDCASVDEKVTPWDTEKMRLYSWIDWKKLKEIKDNNPEVFSFFQNIDVDFHYIVELARTWFNISDFKWFESIFTKETIVDIVALHNRNNDISNDDIKFYFTTFAWKLDLSWHLTFHYIEQIDSLIWWDTNKLKPYIDRWFTLIETYEILKKDLWLLKSQEDIYKEELWNLANINSLIENWCSLEMSKKYLDFFSSKGISFDWKDLSFLISSNISPETALKYLEINDKFSWKDIKYLVLWKVPFDEIKKCLSFDWKLTWFDITFLINSKVPFDKAREYLDFNPNFTWEDIAYLNSKNISIDSVKKYLWLDKDLSWKDIVTLYWIGGTSFEQLKSNFEQIKSSTKFSNNQIVELLSKKVDTSSCLETYEKLKNEISLNNIYLILLNWVTYWHFEEFVKANSIPEQLNIVEYTNLRLNWLTDKDIAILCTDYLSKIWLSWVQLKYQFLWNLSEIWKMKNLHSLLSFLDSNKDAKINIGWTDYNIWWNIQFLRWLLDHVTNNLKLKPDEIDWNKVISSYWEVLNGFVEVNKTIDKVYFLSSNHYFWEDQSAYQYQNIDRVRKIYNQADVYDFTTWKEQWDKIKKTNDMVWILEEDLKNNPWENFLLYVSLHWDVWWNAWTSKWNLSQEDFDRLNKIAWKYSNLKVVIDSCNNASKFWWNDLQWNIVSNSWNYYSTWEYWLLFNTAYEIWNTGFLNWDFNKDWKVTSQEAELYVNVNYKSWLIHNNSLNSFYRHSNDNKVSIDNQIINN